MDSKTPPSLIPAGKIAAIHGRKKIFIFGLAVYTGGSTAAGFVPHTFWFLFLRVVQGLGAAMFMTTGMAILTSVFPPHRRGRAIGVYVAAVYIGRFFLHVPGTPAAVMNAPALNPAMDGKRADRVSSIRTVRGTALGR